MTADTPTTDGSDNAADESRGVGLNGAQVTALLAVLASVSAGELDEDAAVTVITTAFPSIAKDVAIKMVAGAKVSPETENSPQTENSP